MIEFIKDKSRLHFAFTNLGIYLLSTFIWKQIFGIFHYIMPFLGVIGSIYTGITSLISFVVTYYLAYFIFKKKHPFRFSYVLLISFIIRVVLSIFITVVPFTSILNYLYPIMVIYLLDYIHTQKASN